MIVCKQKRLFYEGSPMWRECVCFWWLAGGGRDPLYPGLLCCLRPGEVHQGRLRRKAGLRQEVQQVWCVWRGQPELQEGLRPLHQTTVRICFWHFIYPPINQPINQSINQSISQSINQSINQSIKLSNHFLQCCTLKYRNKHGDWKIQKKPHLKPKDRTKIKIKNEGKQ